MNIGDRTNTHCLQSCSGYEHICVLRRSTLQANPSGTPSAYWLMPSRRHLDSPVDFNCYQSPRRLPQLRRRRGRRCCPVWHPLASWWPLRPNKHVWLELREAWAFRMGCKSRHYIYPQCYDELRRYSHQFSESTHLAVREIRRDYLHDLVLQYGIFPCAQCGKAIQCIRDAFQ